MNKTVDSVSFVNYSNIIEEGSPNLKGATLLARFDQSHPFNISTVSLKNRSDFLINDRVKIEPINHFVYLHPNIEGTIDTFDFRDGSPDILRIFVNGLEYRQEYPNNNKICSLEPLDIIDIQFLDVTRRILFSNIIIIKNIKFVEE